MCCAGAPLINRSKSCSGVTKNRRKTSGILSSIHGFGCLESQTFWFSTRGRNSKGTSPRCAKVMASRSFLLIGNPPGRTVARNGPGVSGRISSRSRVDSAFLLLSKSTKLLVPCACSPEIGTRIDRASHRCREFLVHHIDYRTLSSRTMRSIRPCSPKILTLTSSGRRKCEQRRPVRGLLSIAVSEYNGRFGHGTALYTTSPKANWFLCGVSRGLAPENGSDPVWSSSLLPEACGSICVAPCGDAQTSKFAPPPTTKIWVLNWSIGIWMTYGGMCSTPGDQRSSSTFARKVLPCSLGTSIRASFLILMIFLPRILPLGEL